MSQRIQGKSNGSSTMRKYAPETIQLGDNITYTIIVSNNQNVDMIHFRLFDDLGPNMAYIDNSLTLNGKVVQGDPTVEEGADIGKLEPGLSTVTFQAVIVNIPENLMLTNQAEALYLYQPQIGCPAIERSLLTNKVETTINYGKLGATKEVSQRGAAPGETLLYSIVLKNEGNVAIQTIQVMDTIPVGTTFVEGSLKQDGNPLAGSPSTTRCTLEPWGRDR